MNLKAVQAQLVLSFYLQYLVTKLFVIEIPCLAIARPVCACLCICVCVNVIGQESAPEEKKESPAFACLQPWTPLNVLQS